MQVSILLLDLTVKCMCVQTFALNKLTHKHNVITVESVEFLVISGKGTMESKRCNYDADKMPRRLL